MGAFHLQEIISLCRIYRTKGVDKMDSSQLSIFTLETLKNHKTSTGVSVNQFLKQKHPNGDWVVNKDEIGYYVKVAHLTMKYRWKIVGEVIEAINGRAVQLTPDLHPNKVNIDAKRDKVQLMIYDFVRNTFGEIESMEESIKKASVKFNLTEKEVEAIYLSREV